MSSLHAFIKEYTICRKIFCLRPKKILIGILCITSISCFGYYENAHNLHNVFEEWRQIHFVTVRKEMIVKFRPSQTRHNTSTSCNIPKLNPFDPSILPFVSQPYPANCEDEKHPLIFKTDLNATLIRMKDPKKFGFHKCCYKTFRRVPGGDGLILLSANCIPIVKEKTVMRPPTQYIQIECLKGKKTVTVELLSFLFRKKEVEARVKAIEKKSRKKYGNKYYKNQRKVNVVILGIDAVSHMNFLRVMPSSYKFLTQNLSAMSLSGYTKVGDNTFPNLVPVTMGMSESELERSCWTTHKYFDDCPFIWKEYKREGYTTAYGEDAVDLGIWNYLKNGFYTPPTDYYYNDFTYQLDIKLGHSYYLNANKCSGSRLGFEVLLEFLKKMAVRMGKGRRYFQFIWATSLFHDDLNYGMLGDEALLDTLKWFKDGQYLEDAVLILMSDHGFRWGDILDTFNGKLEERMPFLYFVFPSWFSKKYKRAVENVMKNRERLSTPYDVHETLMDLLRLNTIKDVAIQERTQKLMEASRLPRGISLFLPISESRNCDDAGIPENFCVCMTKTPVDLHNNSLVQEAALSIVNYLNKQLTNFSQCQPLTLKTVLNAQISAIYNNSVELLALKNSEDPQLRESQVTFSMSLVVYPSKGTFEATTTRHTDGEWEVSKHISRTNLYKGQSDCVDDFRVKPFCYCFQPP